MLALWTALTLASLAYVATIGSNCPNSDEWEFVPALLNREPLGPWLWAQHNEHRLPLPRLAYYVLFQITHDFRAGSVLQVALLSGTSLALMSLAARLRGYPYWTDAFFPASLVHVGHWENLLIGYNICFAFILVLETAIGVIALRTTRENLYSSGRTAGVLMVLLCLCGGGGVVTALPVAVWLAYLSFNVVRQSHSQAAILFSFAVVPFAYLAIYLQGYHRPGHHPEVGEGGFDVLRVTGQVVSIAFGHGTYRWWIAVFLGIVTLGAFTLSELLKDWRRFETRLAATGLIAISAGIAGVALVIGLGRAALEGSDGLASRYTYLTWPLIALTYIFWCSRGGRRGKWIPAALCAAAAMFYPVNMIHGTHVGAKVRGVLATVEIEFRQGVPPDVIVRHFRGTFQGNQEERAVRAMPMLRAARIGAFAEGPP